MRYLQVFISAEDKEQASKLLNSLLEKRLVAGGMLLSGPAQFWWKGKIVNMNYYNISAFTMDANKEAIIGDVRKTSVEEVPMVWFTSFEGNEELLSWINQSLK